MKSKIITLFIIIIAIVSVLVGLYISGSQKEASPILKVGMSADYPPFEQTYNGDIVGFDVDLAKHIAKKLNKELNIVEMDFSSLIPALQAGLVDVIISGVAPTEERAKNVDFSKLYFRNQMAILHTSNQPIDSIEDLKNKKIGAQLGSVMEIFLKSQPSDLNIQVYALNKNPQLVEELKLKRIDGLLIELPQAQVYAQKYPGLKLDIVANEDSGYAIALAKGSVLTKKINNIIEAMEQSGELTALEAKWLSNQVVEQNTFTMFSYIAKGIITTLKYASISVIFGSILGLVLALMKISDNRIFRALSNGYTSIFRGTPLLVQLSIVYLGIPTLLDIQLSIFVAGCLAFSLNSGAYVSEVIKAGIQGIDVGQKEAAKMLGLSDFQTLYLVILPQALRKVAPSIVNELIDVVKETALVSVFGETDIMRRASLIGAEYYTYLKPLLIAALYYYIIIFLLSNAAKWIEKRLSYDKN